MQFCPHLLQNDPPNAPQNDLEKDAPEKMQRCPHLYKFCEQDASKKMQRCPQLYIFSKKLEKNQVKPQFTKRCEDARNFL